MFCSFYSYDSTARFLTSVSTGDVETEYSYNEQGDLIYAVNKLGIGKTIHYDVNSWVSRIETFDSDSEFASSIDYTPDYNGRLDIFVRPTNKTLSLVHDVMGNVVSIARDGGLPERYVTLPHGIQHLVGDEVSFLPFLSLILVQINTFTSIQKSINFTLCIGVSGKQKARQQRVD